MDFPELPSYTQSKRKRGKGRGEVKPFFPEWSCSLATEEQSNKDIELWPSGFQQSHKDQMRALSRPLGPQSGYDPSPKGADDIGHPLSQCGIQHGSRTGTHTQVRQRAKGPSNQICWPLLR